MEITSKEAHTATIVSVKNRIDAMTSPEFEAYLSTLLEQEKKNIILNLNELEYISSAGLRVILSTAKKIKADRGSLCFCGLRGSVKEIFEISGFCSILQVFNTEEEALSKL
jgi:anti-anti-sigma factor